MFRLLFLLFICKTTVSQEIDKENEVYVVDSDNFDDAIKEYSPILINFYAPWCQYSQKLLPHFERVAQDFVSQKVSVRLGKVDVVSETTLAEKFGIKRYPTLIFFKDGRTILYNKTNNHVPISNWLLAKTSNLILRISTKKDYAAAGDTNDLLLAVEESKYGADVELAAENIDDVQFLVVKSELFSSLFQKYEGASMVFRRKIDMVEIPFYGTVSQDNIVRFSKSNDLPPVVIYSSENGASIFSNSFKSQHFIVFVSEGIEAVKSELEVAASNHDEVRFAIVDVTLNVSNNIVTFFKIDKDKTPAMILSDISGKRTFKPDFVDISGHKIDRFLTDVKHGRVPQFLKSQKIPDDWNYAPVKVLVGKNFEKVAYDRSKHVFVEFYAPWCTYCKQLAPIWDKLAQLLAHVDDLVIAKLDKTENDIKDIEIKSFPTLKLFLKGSNEIIPYNGLRTKDALMEFLSKYTDAARDTAKEL